MSNVDDQNRRATLLGLTVSGGMLVALMALLALAELPDEATILGLTAAISIAWIMAPFAAGFARIALVAYWRRFTADDGGLRIHHGFAKSYEPFTSLRSVFIDAGTFGRLVAVRHDGQRVLNTPLVTAGQCAEAQRAVKLFEDTKERGANASRFEAFARGDRSFDTWVEHLEAVRTGAAYRMIPTDTATLKETALDVSASVDVRAGAAYLLAGQPDVAPETMGRVLHERTPELIRVMAGRGALEGSDRGAGRSARYRVVSVAPTRETETERSAFIARPRGASTD